MMFVSTDDTVKNKNFGKSITTSCNGIINIIIATCVVMSCIIVMPYPNECDSEKPCGGLGSYCSVMNTLPQKKIRCSCLNGFYSDGSSNVTCKCKSTFIIIIFWLIRSFKTSLLNPNPNNS